MKALDLTGKKFTRYTVLEFYGSKNGKRKWKCQCECGTIGIVGTNDLVSGNSRSCGCLKNELASAKASRHKLSHSKVHDCWCAIRQRCENRNHKRFHKYGARGISVCPRWHVFENFLEDMGHPASSAMSIDRIDNNGNYEPANCRWATPEQQARNKTAARKLTIDGEERSIHDWADITGVKFATIWRRIRLGWTPERAVLQPVK